MEQAKQEMEEQEAAKLVGRQAKLHVVQNWVADKQNCAFNRCEENAFYGLRL